MKFGFKKSSIPNYLTILRIILVPIILVFTCVHFGPVLYVSKFYNLPSGNETPFYLSWVLAGILFIIASITDFLDGFLSRKFNWVSDFGKLWDPIADKILINSVLIVLAGANIHIDPYDGSYCNEMQVFFAIPIVMIIRDTIVDAYRMYASSKNVVVAANIYGKLKTFTQIIAIVLIYFFFAWNYKDANNSVYWWLVQNLFMWVSLILSVVSGIVYACQITKKLKQQAVEKNK